MTSVNTQTAKPPLWNKNPISGVKHIVAIASGKGGVGKSTTTVNLALALKNMGLKVGILDADIHGPSIPRMLAISGQPDSESERIIPLENYGIKCLSMGMLGSGGPMIWRSAMTLKVLAQFLRGAEWGELDFLLVDMPPGTGDLTISLAQQAPLSGVIIVTTPQEIAVMDARKSLTAFRKLGVKVLGVIENMSCFVDPASGAKHHIFGEGGGKRMAEEEKSELLGEIPLDMKLRADSDNGTPAESNQQFAAIAAKIKNML